MIPGGVALFVSLRGGCDTEAVLTDQAVVISADAHRLERFARQWAKAGLDVRLRVHEVERDRDGRRGCWQSHYDVLSGAEGPLLVLEDDAVFAPEVTLDLSVPDGWDLVYLGGEHMRRPRLVAGDVVVAVEVRRTHAYVVADPRRLAAMIGPPVSGQHVDSVITGLPLSRWAVVPFSVGQAAGKSLVFRGESRVHPEFWNRTRRPRRAGVPEAVNQAAERVERLGEAEVVATRQSLGVAVKPLV
jgi:hypothetical protein